MIIFAMKLSGHAGLNLTLKEYNPKGYRVIKPMMKWSIYTTLNLSLGEYNP